LGSPGNLGLERIAAKINKIKNELK